MYSPSAFIFSYVERSELAAVVVEGLVVELDELLWSCRQDGANEIELYGTYSRYFQSLITCVSAALSYFSCALAQNGCA